MNYCSIEDAWGNNFNKDYYEFDNTNVKTFDNTIKYNNLTKTELSKKSDKKFSKKSSKKNN